MVKDSTVSIVTYWWGEGAHYIATEYDAATEKYNTMNTFRNETSKIARPSLDKFFNTNNYSVLSVITINK